MAARLTPLVAGLPATVPFVGPEAQERLRGRPFAHRIGANESVFGPSPKAMAAMAEAVSGAWMYGDPECHDLRAALARHHDVPPEAILVGEGIDGLLGLTVRLIVSPGDTVVTSDGAYPTFNYHVAGFGGALHKVPYRDDAEDADALLAAARASKARLVYLCNPDNPMGSWLPADRIAAAIADVPDGALLVLDEAYADFAPDGTVPPLDPSETRVLRMRTFSKAYGLAGIRVGYAIGHPDLIAAFNRIRNHFGVGRVVQAGAMAALEDQGWLAGIRDKTAASRDRIGRIARAGGLDPLPSAANFVTVDCGRDAAFAGRLVGELGSAGIFVRMPFAAPGNRCIRIGCGTDADLDALETVLPEALARAG